MSSAPLRANKKKLNQTKKPKPHYKNRKRKYWTDEKHKDNFVSPVKHEFKSLASHQRKIHVVTSKKSLSSGEHESVQRLECQSSSFFGLKVTVDVK